MSLANWMLTSCGTTKSCADWKLQNATIKSKGFAAEQLTFIAPALEIDADPLFSQWSEVSLADPKGVTQFVGIVTRIPASGTPNNERQSYEIANPWWYLENLVFQQDWYSTNGITTELISTLRSLVIMNQQLDGTQISLGALVTAIFNYALTTAASYPVPFVPFTVGINTITTNIPLTEVKDKSCAQILIDVFAWVPDAVQWFDYTTTPPTLNIDRRGNLKAVTLPAYGNPTNSVNLTPRADLVVPAVVCKYWQHNTIDGNSYNVQIVDIYPPDALDPAFRNMVLDLELDGGQETFQKQTLKTTDRPTDYNAITNPGSGVPVGSLAWLKGEHRADWLKGYTIPAGTDPDHLAYGSPGNATLNDINVNVDETKLIVVSVITTLVSNNGANLILPTGTVAPGTGPGTNLVTGGNALDYLTQELLEGTVPVWLTTQQNIFSARVRVDVTLQYTGDDPVIQALFSAGPTFYKKISCPVNVTNGSTQTYSAPTSLTPSEPEPVGLAQILYEGLSVLHYDGQIVLVERECSGQVGLNNVLNLSGGRAEWATMNAQVFEITRLLDTGRTTLRIGPPKELTGAQWVDMLKAARGRVQTWHADDRTSGQPGADNTVQGPGSAPISGTALPPSMLPSAPWRVLWRHGPGNVLQAMVTSGNLYNLQGSAPALIPVDNLNTWVTCTPAVPGGDAFWIEGTVQADPIAPSGATMRSIGQGDNDFDPTGATASWDASGKGDLVNDGASPPNQTKFRALLATVTADGNGNPVIKATRSQDLVLKNKNVNGEPCIFPEPYGN